jgi:hypothetical protein
VKPNPTNKLVKPMQYKMGFPVTIAAIPVHDPMNVM